MNDEASLKPALRTRSEAGQQLRSELGSHLRSKSSDRSAVGGGVTGASEPEGRTRKILYLFINIFDKMSLIDTDIMNLLILLRGRRRANA